MQYVSKGLAGSAGKDLQEGVSQEQASLPLGHPLLQVCEVPSQTFAYMLHRAASEQ